MGDMAIGELAALTGVKIPTIRYYEQIGLLPPPARSAGNRRLYDDRTQRRLVFIRHARDLGFEVEAIRQLLDMCDQPDRSCHQADSLARAHLADIESRIARLETLRREVQRMIDECSQDRICHCRVIEVLADHGQCLHEHH
ncbi:helix-turn-helix domain-containing protein [Caenispirillum bisanense]|uniref:MerR family transcriptional regulator n=1 Tax=Caenispirillum bisanense TaxID=414052 RepID=UPI0031DCFE1A